MIILREKKKTPKARVLYQEGLVNLKEANNLPVIAKIGGVATDPRITNVVRQDTIFSTLQAMGLDPYINKMNNVVCDTPDSATMSAVASTIYTMFGVKCSFVLTWNGTGKCYWDPKAPVEKAPAMAYAQAAGLPPPNFRRYLA
jgi:hypothetical protein